MPSLLAKRSLAWAVSLLRFTSVLGSLVGPEVLTSCGRMRGTQDEASGASAFLGIPYAHPPVGQRRWRPPELLTGAGAACWNGTLDASLPGAACLQKGRYSKGARSSEDCLRLHVHTKNLPVQGADGSNGQDLKPTLVWFHGGGLVEGSPFAIQSGFGAQANLTSDNEVVVVSVQYRLAVAGFLSLAALRRHDPRGMAGNYGLLDSIAALEWIQQNIRAFGGDPGRVTVWGQSSGGSLVMALLASPQAQGLIHGAISMSGSPRLNSTTVEAEEYWHRKVVQKSRCASIGFSASEETRMLDCLLSLDEDELLDSLPPDWEADVWSLVLFEASWQYAPILLIDGPNGVLPEPYLDALRKEKLDVPVILGVTREESDFAPGQDVRNLSGMELAKVIKEALVPNYSEDFIQDLVKVYGLGDTASDFRAQQVYAQILSDATTVCSNFYLAGVMDTERQSKHSSKVFAYIESRGMQRPFCPLGAFNHFDPPYCPHYAFHAVDEFCMIEPAFGPGFAYNLTAADRAHGRFLREKLLEFVVKGEVSDWSRFVPSRPSLQQSLTVRNLPEEYSVMDLGSRSAEAMYHQSRCNFWLQAGFYDSRGLINTLV